MNEFVDLTGIIGNAPLGIIDKNGNEICEGYFIKHNNIIYLVKWSKNQNQWVARAQSKSWRDLKWMKNVSKHIEIVGNIHFNKDLYEQWKQYI